LEVLSVKSDNNSYPYPQGKCQIQILRWQFSSSFNLNHQQPTENWPWDDLITNMFVLLYCI